MTCQHLHDTTSRYDPVERLLTFLLVCPVCGTERAMRTVRYEPRFEPDPDLGSAPRNVRQFPMRDFAEPARRAA